MRSTCITASVSRFFSPDEVRRGQLVILEVSHDRTMIHVIQVDYVVVLRGFSCPHEDPRGPRELGRRPQGFLRSDEISRGPRVLRCRSRGFSCSNELKRGPRRLTRHPEVSHDRTPFHVVHVSNVIVLEILTIA